MIIVHVTVDSSPEAIETVKEALATMEAASRAEEGCVDYTFCTEVTDPSTARVVECWESMDALMAHFTSPHMAAFQQALQANPMGEMKIKMFEATETAPPGA